jgi:hypothetical protein
MNDINVVTLNYDSCIRIAPSTDADAGGNMQLDLLKGGFGTIVGTRNFPHIWIPETATVPTTSGVAGTALDNTTWVFACRIGLRADITTTGSGVWSGKAFIGWAMAGDTSVMTAAGGAITVNGTVANGATAPGDTMWFDLALRMDITDMSDNAANGSTRFFSRGPLNRVKPTNAGKDEFAQPGEGYMPWVEHGTVLTNQTPNSAEALVPTIEVINGDNAGEDCIFYLDWWAMGRSRPSRSAI